MGGFHASGVWPWRQLLTTALVVLVVQRSDGQGPLKGDAGLLQTVATKYGDNLARLDTWQGEVRSSHWSTNGEEEYRVDGVIEFACDRAKSRSWYCLRETKNVKKIPDQEEAARPLNYVSELVRDGVFHRLRRRLANEDRPKMVVIQSKAFMRPAFHNGMFAPLFFFTDAGADIDKICRMYFEHSGEDDFDGSIARRGDVVTLTRFQSDPSQSLVFVFDLAKSGAPLMIERSSVGAEATTTSSTMWSWQEVSGVWAPKSVVQETTTSGNVERVNHTELTWTKSIVNEPLAEDDFSLVRMGLRRGDRVYDTRTGTNRKLNDEEFPIRR